MAEKGVDDRLPGRHHDRAAPRRAPGRRPGRDAEFFSFGTNDLTQTTFGISRDDSRPVPRRLHREGHLREGPLRHPGPGGRRRPDPHRASSAGARTRPDIKLGICGEHGGDPASIAFCESVGLDYVSCSPYRVPIARLAAAQAALNARKELDSIAVSPGLTPGVGSHCDRLFLTGQRHAVDGLRSSPREDDASED